MKREIEKKYDLKRSQLKEVQAERRDEHLFKFEVQLKVSEPDISVPPEIL